MNILILFSAILLLAGFLLKDFSFGKVKNFSLFAIAAVIIRLAAAYLYFGHKTDVTDFLAWSDMLFKDGIPSFYTSGGFTDYPPGYMYVLWIVGCIKNVLSINGAAAVLLVKLPPIAADICTAVLLNKYLKNRNSPNGISVLLLFNPAAVVNSAFWGQTDSVFTLFAVLSLIALTDRDTLRAYLCFAAAVFIKPQACMFAPIYIYYFVCGIKKRRTKEQISSIVISVAAVAALACPFGIKNVIAQYAETLASYAYASVNAFNIWAALGLNWQELTPAISAASAIFIAAITAAAFYLLHSRHEETKYFNTAVFICFSVFMLSAKMHERYAYPAMIIAAFAIGTDARKYTMYRLLSVSHFFNTAYILFVYETNPSVYYKSAAVTVASFINIAVFLYMTYICEVKPKEYVSSKIKREKSTAFDRFTRADITAISVITIVYACVAFANLGSFKVPQTEITIKNATLQFAENENVSKIKFYLGSYPLSDDKTLTFSVGTEKNTCSDADVFSWNTVEFDDASADSVVISADSGIPIREMRVINQSGDIVRILNRNDYPELFDENVPAEKTYMTGTYFDEIYHARTAYEFIHKLPVYEWTHPPLGKIFISIGIRIFGMNTFGWRCMGALFGVLMLPVLYVTAKLLFRKTWLCSVTTLIFAFDFMHYTQSRIATIDVFVTFFIMLMYLFMYAYSYMSFYDKPLAKTFVPLILCGVSSGLAIASKWTGIYALSGIAVIFFATLWQRCREYSADKTLKFYKNSSMTLIFCVLCFIIIPIGIYCLSYIPYLAANSEGIEGIWKNQVDIFTYHSDTVVSSEHAFASKWYTWPVMLRPIWYYSASFADGREAGISAFGNPLVWWGGIAASLFCLYRALKYRDKKASLLLAAYAADFLPWALVKRTMFIYHYFPSVPFVVLMIGYSLDIMCQKRHKVKYAAYVYTLCVILLFALFYPVLTGTPADPGFVKSFLRWLPGWVLIK